MSTNDRSTDKLTGTDPADLPCPWWSEEILRREYIEKDRPSRELASEWGCWPDTIRRAARKHGLPRKQGGGARRG